MSLVFFLFLNGIFDVYCKHQMEWRRTPDLVNEFNPIQGRENYNLMVAIVGDTVNHVCEIDFASKPVKNVVWEIDGKIQNREKTQKEYEDNKSHGKIFLEDVFEIVNITKEMDDKRVSCVYDEESVETILHVFKLDIEIPKHVCGTCTGDVDLLFKESLRSKNNENNVDARIKSKIAEKINVTPSEVSEKNSNSEYSVTLPIATAWDNQAVRNMNPELSCDWNTVCQEKQEKDKSTIIILGVCILVSIFGFILIIVKVVKIVRKRWVKYQRVKVDSRKNSKERQNPNNKSHFNKNMEGFGHEQSAGKNINPSHQPLIFTKSFKV